MTQEFDFSQYHFEPEKLPQADRDSEIWSPFGRWNCFCCADTGFVQKYLVKKVMPNYGKSRHDKDVMCTRCKIIYDKWAQPIIDSSDKRFSRDLCEQLDQYCRQDWRNTIKKKQEMMALHQSDPIKEKLGNAMKKAASRLNVKNLLGDTPSIDDEEDCPF